MHRGWYTPPEWPSFLQPREGQSHQVHFSFQPNGVKFMMAAGIPPRGSQRGHVDRVMKRSQSCLKAQIGMGIANELKLNAAVCGFGSWYILVPIQIKIKYISNFCRGCQHFTPSVAERKQLKTLIYSSHAVILGTSIQKPDHLFG